MTNVLYLDCFAGAAGDMLLAALLDLGFSPAALAELPRRLALDEVRTSIERVKRGAIDAALIRFDVATEQPHRRLSDIYRLIEAADLPPAVSDRVQCVFRRLAEAEATVHGCALEHVHFHEVGAVDSILDIVGFCLGLHELAIDKIVCSPLPLGQGQTRSAHGTIPLPAPATVVLLGGAPVYAYAQPVETVTPTGAALISTLVSAYGGVPTMRLRRVGYGAGTRVDPDGPPNVVRALLGDEQSLPETAETTFVVEANIDDMNPEYYEPLGKRLEEAGALDVSLLPAIMKRGRPGVWLAVVCPHSALERVIEAVFVHSTTLGLRYFPTARAVCERRVETVNTSFGPVRIKHAYYQGKLVHSKPEYADLAGSGLPIAEALRIVEQELAKRLR